MQNELMLSVEEMNDGEIIILREIWDDGIEMDQIRMTRECAKSVVELLQEIIGDY